MCDNSRLSGISNVHEYDVFDTAEPNRADKAQLAQWLVNGKDDFELINLKPWSSLFIISLAQRTVNPRRVFPDLRFLFSGVWSLRA